MSDFRISGTQLRDYTQGLESQATDGQRGVRQTQAKARLHEMAFDLIGSSGQVKSGYLRLHTNGQDQVSLRTNRWQHSDQTDAATALVRQLVKEAYGENEQVEAALKAYLDSGKNNKLGTRSFLKLVAGLDQASSSQVQERLATALQGRVGSLNTDLFAAGFQLQQQKAQAAALAERLGPLLKPQADRPDRRQLISELIDLREDLNKDFSKLSEAAQPEPENELGHGKDPLRELLSSSTALQIAVERNIKELLQVHCQELGGAVGRAASYQVKRDSNLREVIESLQDLRGEIANSRQLRGRTTYPLALTQLGELDAKAERLLNNFTIERDSRRRNPEWILKSVAALKPLGQAQDIQQVRARLTELIQQRRQAVLAGYAQARDAAQGPEAGIAQAKARWDEQTAAIEAQLQTVLAQIEQQHSQSIAQLEHVHAELRQDMGDAEPLRKFDAARAAMVQNLASERDSLQLSIQALPQDALGAPQAALARHLASAQWAEAAPLLATQKLSTSDLAQLALALDLQTQPDELARFMKFMLPNKASVRSDFLTQVLPRGNAAAADSAPYLACLNALEQMEPNFRLGLLEYLTRSVGLVNPGTNTLAGGADALMVRLDDPEKPQRLASARQALVSLATPKVNLQGADLSDALLHIQYRPSHTNPAWAPSLTGARLDRARIMLDGSALELDKEAELLPLFGFDRSLQEWEDDERAAYLQDKPDAEELPEALLQKIAAGPAAEPGLYSMLASISTDYPEQRKSVACQLLDLALQVPTDIMTLERLLARCPLFADIRQDPALMADPDVTLRLNALSSSR
jgi:hypothetical protein